MTKNTVTPTEELLRVAKSFPFAPAVRTGSTTWSYAALWNRVRELSTHIDHLDHTRGPVGLHMGLEIDYIAGAHSIWLSGRAVVVLSPKWSPAIMESILKRTGVQLILYGNTVPSAGISVPSFCTFDFVSISPPSPCHPPPSSEAVQVVPIICSVTPTSGSTGIPKSIVYPMRKSLSVLDEESSTLLKPKDGQWLRGGTTFLRPLFEIRRFMFNQTTLYLDPAISVADQCHSFCAELEETSNLQPLRVHFTPSVFRAFVDYVKMKYGPMHSFSRVYWMVIGGESLTVGDIAMAKQVFPQATIACNYACSEVGFAGVCQMFVGPDEPVPELVNFNATHGCEDLVLLDDDMNIIPKTDGTSGIIGIVTDSSTTGYMGNEEATQHMFRPWGGDRILLYTDDIGQMAVDGRISINGRRSRNVKINGLFVDMDHVEAALTGAFDDSVVAYKLVKSGEKIVLFWTGGSSNMGVLKSARETLRRKLGDNLAMVLSSTRRIDEMPYNASYKVDLAKLQFLADEDQAADPPVAAAVDEVLEAPRSRTCEVAEEIAAEVCRLNKSSKPVATNVPFTLIGLNSLMVVQLYFFLQEHYDYDDEMSRLFDEGICAMVLARDITGEVEEEELIPYPIKKIELATDIVREVARLAQSTQPVPTNVPLVLVGLNSITIIQLHFWLQEHYDYDDDMSRLFEEDCSAEALASDILGEDPDVSSIAESSIAKSSVTEAEDLEDHVGKVACAVAAEVSRLSKSLEPVPIDVPLTLAGLNSITVVQLHFWLQAQYDYNEDMSRLFEEDVSAEVVARDIMTAIERSESSSAFSFQESDSVPLVLSVGAVPDRPVDNKPAPLDLDSGWSNLTYGLLALALLSPPSPAPSAKRPTPVLTNLLLETMAVTNSHLQTVSMSPWMQEVHSPRRMLYV